MSIRRIVYIASATVLLALVIAASVLHSYTLAINGIPDPDKPIYLRTDSDYADLLAQLKDQGLLRSTQRFDALAQRMNLPNRIKAGKYVIDKPLSNLELVRKFRSGDWETQVIRLGAEMSRDSLLDYLALHLQAERSELDSIMASDWTSENGFNTENVYCIFLPDHYHFNWATTAQEVVDRFYGEYKKFWNSDRLGQAYALDLSAEEACILATIVDGEAIHVDEMPRIAGLYLNRLKRGIRLQSDPTSMFVDGALQRRRVLYRDTDRAHRYNTYQIDGLPPGPILFPDKRAIEAVLHAESHDFIFMCAIGDGSYRHNFATNGRDHQRNVALYRKNRRNR